MKIIFAEPIGFTATQKDSFSDKMKEMGHAVRYFDVLPLNQEELLNRISDADILVLSNYSVSSEVIEKSVNLRLIVVAFTGVDHIPIDICKSKGIVVCNAAGYSTQAVAELTIALAINLYRKVIPLDGSTRVGRTREGFLGRELRGKIFGIIGFGAIGERTAKLAQAFGCKVIAWSRSEKTFNDVEFVPLERLFQLSDIISIHLPLTDKTRGLVDGSNFKLIKPTALLINTARGPIVDYYALAAALKTNKIAGAAVDVYDHEPPIEENHPLFSAPNTILLPHIGFATHEAIFNRSEIVISNINSWLEGKPDNQI